MSFYLDIIMIRCMNKGLARVKVVSPKGPEILYTLPEIKLNLWN